MTGQRLAKVLSAIELEEMQLLSWGAHHGRYEREELERIVALAVAGGDVDQVIDELVDRGLVFAVPGGGYRSRMAETVRILATLRQTFSSRPWWQSPELVLDYRLLHRPRSRPARTMNSLELASVASEGYVPHAQPAIEAITPRMVAAFQVRAAEAIHSALQKPSDAGVVISAGTGSGKTLAFYLPVIAWMLDSIAIDAKNFVRVLAIYPRNELLKDQIQNLLVTSLAIPSLPSSGSRPLRIGAWFGAVPRNAFFLKQGYTSWKMVGKPANPDGWECPFLNCPDCDKPLLWKRADVDAKVERLECRTSSCRFSVEGDRICLTRESAVAHPPDVMFTTTESINRQLASPDSFPAFGLSAAGTARVVLLDEAHTYEGITGAQSAYLLRRLRHALGRNPVLWAGLSATLLEARQFFADLVGIGVEAVSVTEPTAGELEESGAEYLLALRHNPASQTGPLSATIQTAMALERCLDRPQSPDGDPFGPTSRDSGGLFGSRTFVFTDKLDVTNRLYWDLLDAEGWWDEGKPIGGRVPTTLAHLRSTNQLRLPAALRDDSEARLESGQWWWLSEAIGHDLETDQSLRVGRTSSQDQGVSDADVIVATASLEVGYDDDRVGAVIQHKAPHDAARFLQRKGRAGRSMEMRPWTVVVLSDWGRDRFAWQAYDQLFDPQLEASRLPVGNRYVQRMQAVYATLDWLGGQLRIGEPDRNVWADLAGPASIVERNVKRATERRRRQDALERILAEILDGGPARGRLLDHLQHALGLTSEDVDALAWTPPRSLLLAVIPTAYRRIAQQWAGEVPDQRDRPVRTRTPLTDFVAGNLFDDLLTPEVEVQLPGSPRDPEGPDGESLSVFRVLREFLPGNVSRHFGVRSFSRRHWIPLPDAVDGGARIVNVDAYGGQFVRTVAVLGEDVSIYRPTRLVLMEPESAVLDSSNSSPKWESQLEALGAGAVVEPPTNWRTLLTELRFHLHADGDGVRVCRFTRRAVGALRLQGWNGFTTVRFAATDDTSSHVALGAEFDADGIMLRITVPPLDEIPRPIDRSLRLTDEIQDDEGLAHLNWTTRVALTSALLFVIAECHAGAKVADMVDRELALALRNAVYRLGFVDEMVSTEQSDPVGSDERIPDLTELVGNAEVLGRLRRAVAVAANDQLDAGWQSWHRRRVGAAMGSVFVEAASQLVSSFDPSDVSIDVALGDGSNEVVIWISEENPGGNGLVESLHIAVTASSSELWKLMHGACGPSDLDKLDAELRIVTSLQDGELLDAVDLLRLSWKDGHEAATVALEGLRSAGRSVRVDGLARQSVGFICARIAGPGAPGNLVKLIGELLRDWDQLEGDSSFAFDARIFGATRATDVSLDGRLSQTFTDERRRGRAISGLFWPRSLDAAVGREVPGMRYSAVPIPAVDFLRQALPPVWPRTKCEGIADARAELESALGTHGVVTLVVADARTARLVVRDILENPIEVGALFVFPRLVAIVRGPDGVDVVLAASELEI